MVDCGEGEGAVGVEDRVEVGDGVEEGDGEEEGGWLVVLVGGLDEARVWRERCGTYRGILELLVRRLPWVDRLLGSVALLRDA